MKQNHALYELELDYQRCGYICPRCGLFVPAIAVAARAHAPLLMKPCVERPQ